MPRPNGRVEELPWTGLSIDEQDDFSAIYRESFPPEERRPLESLISTGTRVWVVRHDRRVLGLAMVAMLESAGVALLQYLAVAPSERSTGLGTRLLDALADDLGDEPGIRGVLIEIEVPGRTDGEAARRLRFYQRWGASPVACLRDYFIADFTGSGRLPMVLLWKPLTGGDQPTGDRLRVVLRSIFRSEYAEYADVAFLPDLLAEVVC